MKIETGFGKGVLGFIFKKFLEGKFGVKFVDFSIHDFNIKSLADMRDIDFEFAVTGRLSKSDIIKIIQGGEK